MAISFHSPVIIAGTSGRVLSVLALFASITSPAQPGLKLSSITPGTEWTTRVTNGDFQAQGPLFGGQHPNPTGWSGFGDISADAGTNMVRVDTGIVAKGNVTSGVTVSLRQRQMILEPATDYVLSAYMWNFGDAANYVNTVVDFNDAPGEPQLTLYVGEEADQGYFIYNYFNTSVTGTNLTLRVFYDGFTGAGVSSAYFPLAAQWDNIAITKASYFAPTTNEQYRSSEPITIKHQQRASVAGYIA